MIQHQQSLNEVAEMQQQIQETGEIMIYLTSVRQKKDISQINKQFQGTLMNKVIPRDLFEFFHTKVKMDKDRYENQIYKINEKTEKTKYMQTLSYIYQLLRDHNLGQDYIHFLMNFINKKPDYTKANAVTLMYRMRLTGIIMLEHYLKYKNGKTNLYDFNTVWNSLYSKTVEFNRKHQQQKINFADQTAVVDRCEKIIKQYEQDQQEETQRCNRQNINPFSKFFRATGLKKANDATIDSNGSSTVPSFTNQKTQQQAQTYLSENAATSNNLIQHQKHNALTKNSNQMDLYPESSLIECHQSQNHQQSATERKRRQEEKMKKDMDEIRNEIEQEVSILIKGHYMFQLNITMPQKVLNFQDSLKKESYLSIFQDERKQLIKKIEDINKQMEQLKKLQTQLYEASLLQQYTASQQQQQNQRNILDQCRKNDSLITNAIVKMDIFYIRVQQYQNHFNSLFPNKLKETFHHDSQPVLFQQAVSQNLDQASQCVEEKITVQSIEEIKEISNSNVPEFSSLSSKNKAYNLVSSATQLVTNINPNETIMTRRKAQQLKIHSNIEISDNNSLASAKLELTPPIKKQPQHYSQDSQNDGEKNIYSSLNNYSTPQTICFDPYLQSKTQYDERIKVNSQQKNQKESKINVSNQIPQNYTNLKDSQREDTKQNKGNSQQNSFQINNSTSDPKMKDKSNNITNIDSNFNNRKSKIQSEKTPLSKYPEEIVIKSDYEEQQEKFKNYHQQLKQLSENFNIALEEFDHIIHLLKIYQLTYCLQQQKTNYQEVQNATSSQLDKCMNFLDSQQQFEEQINFIENQQLHFPNNEDLTFECQQNFRKKLKVSKQIVYETYQKQKEKADQNQQLSKTNQNINSSYQEESESVSIQISPEKQKYSYINSLKLLYQPHSNIIQTTSSFQKIIQDSISFQQQFFEESQSFYNNFKGYNSITSQKVNNLLKSQDSLKNLFSIC